MGKGDKTKELWKDPEYRKHMSMAHKGQKPTNIEQLRKINYKEDAKKRSIHKYLDENYNKTDCVICGSSGGKRKVHWANLNNHNYTRNPKDYIPLCTSCHWKWDSGNLPINLFEWKEKVEVYING